MREAPKTVPLGDQLFFKNNKGINVQWSVPELSPPPAPVLSLQPPAPLVRSCMMGLPGVLGGLFPSQDVPLALCWVSFCPWFTSQHLSHSALMRTYGCWCLLPTLLGLLRRLRPSLGAVLVFCSFIFAVALCSWVVVRGAPMWPWGSSCVSNASFRGPLGGHWDQCVRQVILSLLSEDLDVWLLCVVPYKYLVRKGGVYYAQYFCLLIEESNFFSLSSTI